MIKLQNGNRVTDSVVITWKALQVIVWLAGAGILTALLFFPRTGLLLFWNILIPVAPALFVIALGAWRNVCPLATTNLVPRKLGLSKGIKLSAQQIAVFNLAGVIALYIIVPLRHAVFNNNGMATGIMIIVMSLIGISLGFFFEGKSAWCSGLCPVHPVEKLYGGNVGVPVPNMNCSSCVNCVIPCPDSTPNMHPSVMKNNRLQPVSGHLLIGGLPGFIWGWFHVPDEHSITTVSSLLNVYRLPVIGLVFTLAVYWILLEITGKKNQRRLISCFAAMSVSCYYWYRVPSLIGFGDFADDGLLINLRGMLSEWVVPLLRILTTAFFFYWLVFRQLNKRSWTLRPAFAKSIKKGHHF